MTDPPDLPPPAERLELLSAEAEEALQDPARLEEAVELRQTCLALAQLACAEDDAQVARAAADLASAYLQVGQYAAAARHAAHAESLLVNTGHDEPALLAKNLNTLACALANSRQYSAALECLPRALAQSDRAFGKRHLSTCSLLRAFSRLAATRDPPDYTRAKQLLESERSIRIENAGAPPWADDVAYEMRQVDQECAIVLLRHARQLDRQVSDNQAGSRRLGASRAVTSAERAQARQSSRPTSSMAPPVSRGRSRVNTSTAAREIEPTSDAAKVGAPVELKPAQLIALATRKRQEATQLLLSASQPLDATTHVEEGTYSATDLISSNNLPPIQSSSEARLAVQLASAYAELEKWQEAEQNYLKAIPWYEEDLGFSHPRVVSLWTEVASLRMRMRKYLLAAQDYDHILRMQSVIHGPKGVELVGTAERLCKAHVLMRQWREAQEALQVAYDIASERYGADHRDAMRISDVLKNIGTKHSGPTGLPDAAADGQLISVLDQYGL